MVLAGPRLTRWQRGKLLTVGVSVQTPRCRSRQRRAVESTRGCRGKLKQGRSSISSEVIGYREPWSCYACPTCCMLRPKLRSSVAHPINGTRVACDNSACLASAAERSSHTPIQCMPRAGHQVLPGSYHGAQPESCDTGHQAACTAFACMTDLNRSECIRLQVSSATAHACSGAGCMKSIASFVCFCFHPLCPVCHFYVRATLIVP